MFHVEHHLKRAFDSNKIEYDMSTIYKLHQYVRAIIETNKKFNITGLSTEEEITNTLIIQSILPLRSLVVPRGTKFIDMGTGAGIPGIPLCLIFPYIDGFLIDSNKKKINFIESIIRDLGIPNANAICARGEEIAKDTMRRETFLFCTTRAFSNILVTSEICAPLIQTGGFLYIYSNATLPNKSDAYLLWQHLHNLGLKAATLEERKSFGLGVENIVLIKFSPTPLLYPRRFSAIKREANNVLQKISLSKI